MVDGSLEGVGLIENEPIRIEIADGLASRISGGKQAERFLELVEKAGEGSRNLAEFGVGTNDRAEIRGSVLEDEKVMGTIHLALGNNVSMGGTVNVGFHVDGILRNPTVDIDGKRLLDDGKLLI